MPAATSPLVRLRLTCGADDAVTAAFTLVEERVQLALAEIEDDTVAVSMTVVELEEAWGGDRAGAAAAATDPTPTADPAAEKEEPVSTMQRQHIALLAANARLQGLVRRHLDGISKASRKSLQEAAPALLEEAQQRYELALQQLRKLVAARDTAAATAAAALAPEAARAAAAQFAADARRASFHQLVTNVAAACGRAAAGGAPRAMLPARVVQHWLAAEPAAADECRALRLSAARLAAQVAAAEARLKARDSLSAEGLHLVDFEQLRIESAGLAAKQEARGAEAEKLRARLAQAVQITAHVREKLHSTELQRSALEGQLAAAGEALGAARAELAAAKAARQAVGRQRESLAQDWSIVADRRCLEDLEVQQERLAVLQAQATELQARYEAAASGG